MIQYELPTAATAPLTDVGSHFVANYPPFSTWGEEAIPELEEELDVGSAGKPLSLYVHLPFCRRRCSYCYFRVHEGSKPPVVELYIDAVLRELALYNTRPALDGRRLVSVYFGGGSPTFLAAHQLRRLLSGLRSQIPWDSVIECTVECDPGTLTTERLLALQAGGVTRLSLGFQTLSPRALRESGRTATADECFESLHLARTAGFDQINVDLLAGLPGETESTWIDTVERVAALGPECVTIYQLELSHNSLLHQRSACGHVVELAGWPQKRRWVDRAFRVLEDAGYTIASGYMAVRDPARWRFVYTVENFWHGEDLLALGESAFGHFGGVHYQNSDQLGRYLALVNRGSLPVRRAHRLSSEEALRREAILQLKTGVLDFAYFRAKHGVDLREKLRGEIEWLELRGMAESADDGIRLTREGLLQVDWLLPVLYLEEHRGIRYT